MSDVGADDDALVVLDGVSRRIHRFGQVTELLAPVSVTLRSGRLVVVAGPSGSGKTTLCNIVIGWEPTDSGHVHRHDTDASGWAALAVAPQRLALLPELTIGENLVLPWWATRRPVPVDELEELTDLLELTAILDRRPDETSFGQQQRAAIARALLGAPRLAVLDEPTGHQDTKSAGLVVDALRAARDRGTCVLVATHDPDVIDAADEVVRLGRA